MPSSRSFSLVYEMGCVTLPSMKNHTEHRRKAVRDSLRLRASGVQAMGVHFHQGPQGQPAPCFDERCPNPRLSV